MDVPHFRNATDDKDPKFLFLQINEDLTYQSYVATARGDGPTIMAGRVRCPPAIR
jgi:hypothetical protein